MLAELRNWSAFHYTQDEKLAAGFAHFFHSNENANEFSARAYVSVGRNMNETRFYYADAAVRGMMREITHEADEGLLMTITDLSRHVNVALQGIVTQHLVERKCISPARPLDVRNRGSRP
jgi:hypothetical protein